MTQKTKSEDVLCLVFLIERLRRVLFIANQSEELPGPLVGDPVPLPYYEGGPV